MPVNVLNVLLLRKGSFFRSMYTDGWYYLPLNKFLTRQYFSILLLLDILWLTHEVMIIEHFQLEKPLISSMWYIIVAGLFRYRVPILWINCFVTLFSFACYIFMLIYFIKIITILLFIWLICLQLSLFIGRFNTFSSELEIAVDN